MKSLVAITKALSDQTRLRIISALLDQKELCVCQITALLQFATATISRHMSVLVQAELVTSRKEGRWVYYSISNRFKSKPLTGFMQWLQKELDESEIIHKDKNSLKKILACDAQEWSRKNQGGSK